MVNSSLARCFIEFRYTIIDMFDSTAGQYERAIFEDML